MQGTEKEISQRFRTQFDLVISVIRCRTLAHPAIISSAAHSPLFVESGYLPEVPVRILDIPVVAPLLFHRPTRKRATRLDRPPQ